MVRSSTTAKKKTAKKKVSKKTAKKTPPKRRVKKKAEEVSPPLPEEENKVPYPVLEVEVAEGEEPLTADFARKILGWREEGENEDYGNDYLLRVNKKKVRTLANTKNRPFVLSNALALKQEILRGKWRLNGEPIIIGRSGQVLSGQHTLVALILANEDYRETPEEVPFWTSPPTIEKVVVLGVAEDDDTVNTIDTGKPRTLSDVIYRSVYFSDLDSKERKTIAKIADKAVKFFWERTQRTSLKRTHSESLEVISRHPRLLETIRDVYEEREGSLAHYFNLGYTAAIYYLLASSGTSPKDVEAYQEHRSEEDLDFSRWDKANEFVVGLSSGSKLLEPVRLYLAELTRIAESEDTVISADEKACLLAKAWALFLQGESITQESLSLEYVRDEDGLAHLVDTSYFGGIDLGRTLDDDTQDLLTPDPTPEEIEEAKKNVG